MLSPKQEIKIKGPKQPFRNESGSIKSTTIYIHVGVNVDDTGKKVL